VLLYADDHLKGCWPAAQPGLPADDGAICQADVHLTSNSSNKCISVSMYCCVQMIAPEAAGQLRSLACRLMLAPSVELLAQIAAAGQQLTSLMLSRTGEPRCCNTATQLCQHNTLDRATRRACDGRITAAG
jgi:hypothetical protein